MTNARLGLASAIVLLAGCTAQSPAPAPAPAPVVAAPAPAAPVVAAPAPPVAAPVPPVTIVQAPPPARAAAPAPAPAPVAAVAPGELPPGENRDLVIRACTNCHDIYAFSSLRHPRPVWDDIVDSMISRGAQLSNDERQLVVNYLATHLGPR